MQLLILLLLQYYVSRSPEAQLSSPSSTDHSRGRKDTQHGRAAT